MAAEVIGRCTCPLCDSDKASLRLSAKQLAYLCCNTCNIQLFARSDRSDSLLRARLIAEPVKAPEPEPIATPPTPAPPPKPAASKPSWGMFNG